MVHANSFYINLSGKVSIFLNHKKYDDADTVDEAVEDEFNDKSVNSFEDSLTSSLWSDSSSRSKKLREKLGNYVTSLG